MTITSLIKTSLAAVALPPGLWLAGVSPGVASAAGVVAGASLVAWASRHIAQRNRRVGTAPAAPVPAPSPEPAPVAPIAFPARRLERAPAGRGPRDLRCPSSRTLAHRQPARRRIDR
jgi:hypothetical protein